MTPWRALDVGLGVALRWPGAAPTVSRCIGEVYVSGAAGASPQGGVPGTVQVVATPWATTTVAAGSVFTPLKSRVYLSKTCPVAGSSSAEYAEFYVFGALGHSLSWTADLSAAGCSCDVAVYLAAMSQNIVAGPAGDYYCDASGVSIQGTRLAGGGWLFRGYFGGSYFPSAFNGLKLARKLSGGRVVTCSRRWAGRTAPRST
jgi:hypothetical protein